MAPRCSESLIALFRSSDSISEAIVAMKQHSGVCRGYPHVLFNVGSHTPGQTFTKCQLAESSDRMD